MPAPFSLTTPTDPSFMRMCSSPVGPISIELHFCGLGRMKLRRVYSTSKPMFLSSPAQYFKLDTWSNRNVFLPSISGCRNTPLLMTLGHFVFSIANSTKIKHHLNLLKFIFKQTKFKSYFCGLQKKTQALFFFFGPMALKSVLVTRILSCNSDIKYLS